MNDSNVMREELQRFKLPFSKMLPSYVITCWISCKEPWRGQQFCLIRDCNHLRWYFILNLKKSRKGQKFWRNTHSFVYFCASLNEVVFFTPFFRNCGSHYWRTLRQNDPAVVELGEKWVGDDDVALHAVGTHTLLRHATLTEQSSCS